MLILRGYEAGDLDALFALDERCFAPEFQFSRSAVKRFAEAKKARVLMASDGDEVVGFCIVHVERGGLGYVVTLDVAPETRRRGIAGKLMARMEEMLREEDSVFMGLHVHEGNGEAIRFYESLGYELVGKEENFYGSGVHALAYRKSLRSEAS